LQELGGRKYSKVITKIIVGFKEDELLRIKDHPILGRDERKDMVTIEVDGKTIPAYEGEPIAVALLALGKRVLRTTPRRKEPRGIFCAIGRCTDCVMTVNGVSNVRTCVTPVKRGMKVQTQESLGKWRR